MEASSFACSAWMESSCRLTRVSMACGVPRLAAFGDGKRNQKTQQSEKQQTGEGGPDEHWPVVAERLAREVDGNPHAAAFFPILGATDAR